MIAIKTNNERERSLRFLGGDDVSGRPGEDGGGLRDFRASAFCAMPGPTTYFDFLRDES